MNSVASVRHVAIIMDGNGRWAERRGMSRSAGHRQGAEAISGVLEAAQLLGIRFLTLYAFSTENWKRPDAEISALMGLLEEFLDRKISVFQEKNIRLKTVGRTMGLPRRAAEKLLNAVELTRDNDGGTLILALNYGGRAEITDAAVSLSRAVLSGGMKPEQIDEKIFSSFLYDPSVPDPDLLIRTSGEMRISNFLLWQIAYAELYITEKLWPDFTGDDLKKAVEEFSRRKRRFGGCQASTGGAE